MITVTFGTTPFQFDRAIHWLETLLESGIISDSLFVQSGINDVSSLAKFSQVTTAPILETVELMEKVDQSRLVISHAGQGSTRALAARKAAFVLLPRLASYKEHMDDHQLWFAQSVEPLGVRYCTSLESLQAAVLQPPPPFRGHLFDEPKLVDHLMSCYPALKT